MNEPEPFRSAGHDLRVPHTMQDHPEGAAEMEYAQRIRGQWPYRIETITIVAAFIALGALWHFGASRPSISTDIDPTTTSATHQTVPHHRCRDASPYADRTC